jgi:uncharacterized protein (TIGR03067 family)
VTKLAPLLLLGLALPSVAAPVPKGIKKTAPPTVVGEWREMTADADGQPIEPPTGYTWRFDADGTATVIWPNGTAVAAEYKLDPAQTPSTYDWTLPQHNARFVGVYELKGDTLRSAVVSAGQERPTEVRPGGKAEYRVFVRLTSAK